MTLEFNVKPLLVWKDGWVWLFVGSAYKLMRFEQSVQFEADLHQFNEATAREIAAGAIKGNEQ